MISAKPSRSEERASQATARWERARSHWPAILATVLALALFLSVCLFSKLGIIDDAYISLRYSQNLATGSGLVFNPGERVEGYTNFLWTLLLSLGYLFTSKPAAAAVGLGVFFGGGVVALTFFLSRQLQAPDRSTLSSLPASLFLAVQAPLACYSLSGLETTMYSFWLLVGVYFIFASFQSPSRLFFAAAALAAASLTRPEGPALFLFTLFFLVWRRFRKDYSFDLRRLALFVVIYSIPVGAHLLWRHSYYGEWLPNTYYAKMGGNLHEAVMYRGMVYVGRFALVSGLALLLPAALIIPALRRSPKVQYLAGIATASLGTVALEGGDHLALFRFAVPVLPMIALLAQRVVSWFTGRFTGHDPPSRRGKLLTGAAVVLLGVAASLGGALVPGNFGMGELERARLEVQLARGWAGFGRWLKANAPPDSSVAVITAGAIPFYSGLRAIDMLGLNDAHIARIPVKLGEGYIGHEKYDNDYVLSLEPTFILGHHLVEFDRCYDMRGYVNSAYFEVHRDLARADELHRSYRYRCAPTGAGTYYIFFQRS